MNIHKFKYIGKRKKKRKIWIDRKWYEATIFCGVAFFSGDSEEKGEFSSYSASTKKKEEKKNQYLSA